MAQFVPVASANRSRSVAPPVDGGTPPPKPVPTGTRQMFLYRRDLIRDAINQERDRFGHSSHVPLLQRIYDMAGQAQWLGNYGLKKGETFSAAEATALDRNVANVRAANAATPGTVHVPTFVLYGLINRDNAQASLGGLKTNSDYRTWARMRCGAIGSLDCNIVIEADGVSLGQDTAIDQPGAPEGERSPQQRRYTCLRDACNIAAELCPNAKIYFDIGNAGWPAASTIIARVNAANIPLHRIRGFSVNVSNYRTTEDNYAHVQQFFSAFASKNPDLRCVIDTGRNGRGAGNTHLDPRGRALGRPPEFNPFPTSMPRLDAVLWIKGPGGSDSYFNTAHGVWKDGALIYSAGAGVYFPEIAIELVQNAIADGIIT